MALQPVSDIELVRRMLAGDETAFEQFFAGTYPALYRFALVRLSFDRDAAAEVAQAAVCKAIGKLHTFRGEAALLTWMCAFCRHEVYAWSRRTRGVQVELLEDDPEVRAALESLRAPEGIESALDRATLASIVQRALDHLPVHYASALEWKYIDDISVQEIGARLGLSAKAAESLLTRARAAFREGFRTLAPAGSGLEP